ncbi:MAG: hypothetical protein D6826_03740, partial [Alphaproteobacteria bacterium]
MGARVAFIATFAGAVAFTTPASVPAAAQQVPQPPASSGPPGEDLQAIERALQVDRERARALATKAATLAREIQALRVSSIAAARKAQNLEARLSGIEARLRDLAAREHAKVADLAARRRQLGLSLAALQRIALLPMDSLTIAFA